MTHVFLHTNITSGMQSFVHYTSAKDNITVARYLKDSLQTLFFSRRTTKRKQKRRKFALKPRCKGSKKYQTF